MAEAWTSRDADNGTQAAVTTRAVPAARYFEWRARVAAQAVRGSARAGARVVVLGAPTAASRAIRPGDFLFEDALALAPGAATGAGDPTAEPPLVFSSFAGHAAALPPTVRVRWGGAPVVLDAAGDRRARELVFVPATAADAWGADAEPLSEEDARAVLRAAYAARNERVRFVGVAAAAYVVGDARQDAAGVAAVVAGCVALPNTAGRPLHAGDVVAVRLPAEEFPLYLPLHAARVDPRATLHLVDRAADVGGALRDAVAALLFTDASRREWSPLLGVAPLPPDARGDPPSGHAERLATTDVGGSRRGESAAETAALALLAFAEEVAVWTALRAVRYMHGTAADADAVRRGVLNTGEDTADGAFSEVYNPTRAFVAHLLGRAPTGSQIFSQTFRAGAFDAHELATQRHAGDALCAALGALAAAPCDYARGGLGRVVRGGGEGAMVSVNFFA